MLKVGDKIPVFSLQNASNETVDMAKIIGSKNLVIYFYPKDDTPGCTKEACKFRDDFEDFTDLDAMVIGISADSPKSHAKFKEKYRLPFTLLSDTGNTVRKQFGVKGNFLGLIPGRVTFVVDKTGTIVYVFDSLGNAEQHVENSKNVLQKL
jgi:peroxiredoxin Q/BCP